MTKMDVRYSLEAMEEMEVEAEEQEYVRRKTRSEAKALSKSEGWDLKRKDKKKTVCRGKDKFFSDTMYA